MPEELLFSRQTYDPNHPTLLLSLFAVRPPSRPLAYLHLVQLAVCPRGIAMDGVDGNLLEIHPPALKSRFLRRCSKRKRGKRRRMKNEGAKGGRMEGSMGLETCLPHAFPSFPPPSHPPSIPIAMTRAMRPSSPVQGTGPSSERHLTNSWRQGQARSGGRGRGHERGEMSHLPPTASLYFRRLLQAPPPIRPLVFPTPLSIPPYPPLPPLRP